MYLILINYGFTIEYIFNENTYNSFYQTIVHGSVKLC